MHAQLNARAYHTLVRPPFLTERYLHRPLRRAADLEGKRVLDFGCGTGANASIFSSRLYTGVDVDDTRLGAARRRHRHHTFALVHDERLPLRGDSIDLVIVVAVLHHMPTARIATALAEFDRVLTANGLVVVMEPFLHPRRPLSNAFMQTADRGEHIRSEASYLELFAEAGFTTEVLRRFRKLVLYSEILFTATRR